MINIKISGPGGSISYHVAIIRKALRDAGIEPIMIGDSEYPYDGRGESPESEEDFIARVGKIIQLRGGIGNETTIDVYNAPWGG